MKNLIHTISVSNNKVQFRMFSTQSNDYQFLEFQIVRFILYCCKFTETKQAESRLRDSARLEFLSGIRISS